jgi:hypothetical protein
MRSRCGSYQRRARSRSTGHSEYRRLPNASTKAFQSSPERGGVGMSASAVIGSAASAMPFQHALRGRGPDAGQQVQQTESGDAVPRVFDEPQQGQHVLDVGGVKEFQPAELDERNIPARQFDFEGAAVAGCPEQNGLFLQERADSRFSRTRSTMKRAWSASSRTETSCGFVAEVRSVQRFLVKRSLARPMTPLAAARIVCVER